MAKYDWFNSSLPGVASLYLIVTAHNVARVSRDETLPWIDPISEVIPSKLHDVAKSFLATVIFHMFSCGCYYRVFYFSFSDA